MAVNMKNLGWLAVWIMLSLFSFTAKATTIDVLALYTPGLAAVYSGDANTRIDHLVNVSNSIYSDSGLDLQIRIVHTQEVNYPDGGSSRDALTAMTNNTGVFSNVETLRQTYGADMVVLYRPYEYSHGNCGIAWVGGNKTQGDFSGGWNRYMYSHVSATVCPAYVTAHEMGHNMGLYHSRLQDGSGGTYPFALGHGEMNDFVTVMAYPQSFNVAWDSGVVYKFSSPDLDCRGNPCGVDRNNSSSGADAVYTLTVSTPQIADFLATVVDDGTTDGGGTDTGTGTDTGGGGTDNGNDTSGTTETDQAREAYEAAKAALEQARLALIAAKEETDQITSDMEDGYNLILTLSARRSGFLSALQSVRLTLSEARLALRRAEIDQLQDESLDISAEQQAVADAEAALVALLNERDAVEEQLDAARDAYRALLDARSDALFNEEDARETYSNAKRAFLDTKQDYDRILKV